MTYGDIYDQTLEEVYQEVLQNVPLWAGGGKPAHVLMRENDPTMYRCGFSDWLDGTEDMECDCGETIPHDYIVNHCGSDDEVECPRCAGSEYSTREED